MPPRALWGIVHRPDQIYHVTVMPCYDKKLEASRQDFYNEAYATRDVDCVITTGELQRLMQDKGWDLSIPVLDENVPRLPPSLQLARAPPSAPVDPAALPELLMHPGTSSGSYLQSLISTIVAAAPDPGALELTTKTVRSADYEELTLTHRETGEVLFRGAKCYGFRNLQNVVRKVGRDAGVQVGRGAAGRLAGARARVVRKGAAAQEDKGYDYVEVMACPSGCVNGGGQLRPVQQQQVDTEGFSRDWQESGVSLGAEESLPGAPIGAKWGDREWTKKVEAAYWMTLPSPPPTPPLEDKPSAFGSPFEYADELAGLVLREITKAGRVDGKVEWTTKLDDKAESRRQRMFRTQYRAVESEVVGLAVKW